MRLATNAALPVRRFPGAPVAPRNFENFYFITIPEIVAKMKAQHAHLRGLATDEKNLPKTNVLP